MALRPGTKLFSTVCDTQVVVVKAPSQDVEISCGGAPMVEEDPGGASDAPEQSGDGTAIGKRYADDEIGLELLCSRAGAGALTVDGEPLLVKGAKPLPASD